MPLIEPEPPITCPRGTGMRRSFELGCGAVRKRQLSCGRPIAAATKAGTCMNGCESSPPASDETHRVVAVLAQPRGKHTARGARADDDEVEALAHSGRRGDRDVESRCSARYSRRSS